MTKKRLTIVILAVLCWSLTLAGCKDTKGDKAIAEAEEVKAKLAEVQTILKSAKAERESLEAKVASISEQLEKTKSEAATILKLYTELKIQAVEITNERDTAVAEAETAKAMVKKLRGRLEKKAEENREFKEWAKELQATVKEPGGRLEEIDILSAEWFAEEVSRKIEETREPDVVFVPTPQDVVDKMLELARVKKDDLVYDLGCGDGRVVVTAAKRYGCKAIGYDIDPQCVEESLENVKRNNVGHLVKIEQKDIFTLDLSKANVIMLYLLPELNVKLIPQLEKLKPGSRIVSHDFDMRGVRPEEVVTLISDEYDEEHEVYLWTSPLKKMRKRILTPVLDDLFDE